MDIDAIEARAAAATPPPWNASSFGNSGAQEPEMVVVHHGPFNWESINFDGQFVVATPAWDRQESNDAEFIAHAREDIPALTAEVRRLRAELQTRGREWGVRDGEGKIVTPYNNEKAAKGLFEHYETTGAELVSRMVTDWKVEAIHD